MMKTSSEICNMNIKQNFLNQKSHRLREFLLETNDQKRKNKLESDN